MSPWKYTDATRTTVTRTLDNGGIESCFASVLPEDVTPELEDAPNTKALAAEQIQQLEAKHLFPRAVREFMLGAIKSEAAKTGLDPMLLPAYAKLKALDDQIAALRGQL